MTIDAPTAADGRRTALLLILLVIAAGAGLGLIAGAWTAGVLHLPSSSSAERTNHSSGRLLGPVRFPRLADSYTTAVRGGVDAFGIVAPPGGPVSIVIIPPNGTRVAPAQVDIQVRMDGRHQTAHLTACGLWCYRFAAPVLRGSPATIRVDLRTGGTTVRLSLPPLLPPDESALYTRVVHRMTALRAIAAVQRLGTGAGPVLVTRYTMQAPDRVEYTTSGGQHAILIGNHRWDLHQRTWAECPASSGRDPTYVWQHAVAARAGGRQTVDGHRVRLVRLFNLTVPAWFTLEVADGDMATGVHMIAPSHFMHETYRLDKAAHIEPPHNASPGTC